MSILGRILRWPHVFLVNDSLLKRLGWMHHIVLEAQILICDQGNHVILGHKLRVILKWQLYSFLVIHLILEFFIDHWSCCIHCKWYLLIYSIISDCLALNSTDRFKWGGWIAFLWLWFDWYNRLVINNHGSSILDIRKPEHPFLDIIKRPRLWIHSSTLWLIIRFR